MKKTIFLMIWIGCAVLAQARADGHRPGFSPQKFRADLESFIVQQTGLSPKESATFFPLYDEMCKKQRVIFNDMRRIDKACPAKDEDCRKLIKQRDKLDLELKKIQQQYHDKFLNALPARRVFDILKAEDQFHRKMLRERDNRKR